MSFTVFIPDFQRRFEAAGRPRLPVLERMTARARAGVAPPAAEFLAPLFELDPAELAPAPFEYLADGGVVDGAYRLRADFVHLAPDRDQLVLMPAPLLEVTPDEIVALATAFNGLYAAEGWKLELMPSSRAYLRVPRALNVSTHGPDAAAGQAVLEYMPGGTDATVLKQFMNETQMLFHTHPVNQAREDANRPLINSLWLWGGGVLPARAPAHAPGKVLGELPLLRGLSLWTGGRPEAANPDSLERDDILGLLAGDPEVLDRDWMAPLFDRLKSGRIGRMLLYLGGHGLYELDSNAARRFWRRSRPLAAVKP